MSEELSENAEGKVAVEVQTSTGDTAVIHVPEGCTDPVVRYEDPAGVKHEWVNPDAPAAADPGDDTIYDGATGTYIPRVSVSESGSAAETTA